jgi:hypothetical protein
MAKTRHAAEMSLTQWFKDSDNGYYCSLIAHQLRLRAGEHHRTGRHNAALETETIASLIEQGDFTWRY